MKGADDDVDAMDTNDGIRMLEAPAGGNAQSSHFEQGGPSSGYEPFSEDNMGYFRGQFESLHEQMSCLRLSVDERIFGFHSYIDTSMSGLRDHVSVQFFGFDQRFQAYERQ